MDPVTAIAQAISNIANATAQYFAFMQTPSGQKLADSEVAAINKVISDLTAIGAFIQSKVK